MTRLSRRASAKLRARATASRSGVGSEVGAPATHPHPIDEYLAHAEFHARGNQTGIGAAVVRSESEDGRRIWDCVVSDGNEWHYIRVERTELGPFPNISSEDIEEGIIGFAATLPAGDRIRHLLNANPLHVDRNGAVSD